MKYFIELGASVEILTDTSYCASPIYTNIKIHYDIDKAILSFQPDLIHIHWLHICEKYCKILSEKLYSIPITTKIHGFEYTIDAIKNINNYPNIKYIFTYQHLLNECISQNINTDKMIISTIPINTDLHYPSLLESNIDKIKILRVAAGLTTKNIDMFIELANELYDFEFTLLLVRCSGVENVCDEFINFNNQLGGRCKIIINVAREKVGDYMRKSNIYLHTTSQISNYGQPISIAESLACGNYVLARKNPNISYLYGIGDIYETKEEVITLLNITKSWDIYKWNQIKKNSIDLAYTTFIPEVALKNIIDKF
jgi:glycosyltransferase involved in cell wall biosynthesis